MLDTVFLNKARADFTEGFGKPGVQELVDFQKPESLGVDGVPSMLVWSLN